MIRNSLMAISALAAAVALTTSASAQDAVVVKLAGRTPPATYAAIVRAAHAVCGPEHGAEIYAIFRGDNCVKSTVSATLDKIADPALSKYAKARDEFLTLASN